MLTIQELFHLKSDEEITKILKPYIVWLVIFIMAILPITTIAIIDVNKQDKLISKQSAEIIRQQEVITLQLIKLAELEELDRLLSDLKKVEP